MKNKPKYISLFSSAGVGCYGFKSENFECVATNELIERRMQIQKNNRICENDSGYITGDITHPEIQSKLESLVSEYKGNIDLIVATPPCQGMSVANHKKNNEINRNSLVVYSVKLVKDVQPKFFVFENVRSFLSTSCTDLDGVDRNISEVIQLNLGGQYNILSKVINFKEYGSNSSRTRTLVIGTRKDLLDVTPYDLFPEKKSEKTLRTVIGDLPSLSKMGEIHKDDFYHNFKSYSPEMENWIDGLGEGVSAFDNPDREKRPHRIIDGKRVENANKNSDKYRRALWDKVAPCVHTRNDILSSQNTVHPIDNRVFSIRELMRMMTVPDSFRWIDKDYTDLNKLDDEDRKSLLSKNEINIRQSLGEAVPTVIFNSIAQNINKLKAKKVLSDREINSLIKELSLDNKDKLIEFIDDRANQLSLPSILKTIELANAKRTEHAAYYTRQDVCFSMIKSLPDFKKNTINILEPSVGAGNFLPLLAKRYQDVGQVNIDVFDIDNNILTLLKRVIRLMNLPKNIKVRLINADYLLHKTGNYDLVIGNPPYGKVTKNKDLLAAYKQGVFNQDTNNIYSFFLEKALSIGSVVSLIVPKSLVSTPEFNKTRELLSQKRLLQIVDYGEKGFKGVKIETISITVDNRVNLKDEDEIIIESYVTNELSNKKQHYVTDQDFPVWLLYRNDKFDSLADELKFGVYKVFRDRKITKTHTKDSGSVRVLKSRNIIDNGVVNIEGYDSFVDEVKEFPVGRYLNKENCILVPNLTYNPRAVKLPKNSITDGSVAVLEPINGYKIQEEHLKFYATQQFKEFYMIARNKGTRSLNIDSNAVYFFGVRENEYAG